MSNLLKQKHALTLLREKLKEKKEREYWSCKEFGHLARNCRNKEGKEKRGAAPENKFEVLSSRVMQCDVKERIIKKQERVEVECFKCGEKGHKCRECPLWKQMKKTAYVVMPQKAQQERRLAYPIREKVQEGEKRLRRVEEDEVAYMAKPREAQQG